MHSLIVGARVRIQKQSHHGIGMLFWNEMNIYVSESTNIVYENVYTKYYQNSTLICFAKSTKIILWHVICKSY